MASKKITPEVEKAILDAYMGVEDKTKRGKKHGPSRVFMWEDGTDIMMGNAAAFAEFLDISWATVHAVLRKHGHTLWNSPKVNRGEIVNEFIEPEPYAEIIGHTTQTLIPEVHTSRTAAEVLNDLVQAQNRVNELIQELLTVTNEEGWEV